MIGCLQHALLHFILSLRLDSSFIISRPVGFMSGRAVRFLMQLTVKFASFEANVGGSGAFRTSLWLSLNSPYMTDKSLNWSLGLYQSNSCMFQYQVNELKM